MVLRPLLFPGNKRASNYGITGLSPFPQARTERITYVSEVGEPNVKAEEHMAKRRINKSAKIREALQSMGGAEASPKAVVAALAAKKVRVTATQVSNVKSLLKNGKPGKKRGRKAGRPRRKGSDLVSLAGLQAAKRLVESLGSTEAAKAALDALARLT